MYFDDEDDRINPEIFHMIQGEIFAMNSNIEVTAFNFRSVPTHTEDGIPIRKLYVSNLPPKTTRTELFGVFAQYGLIKSCWLRMDEKGPNKIPSPTYAFVTFNNPSDAHKALRAPHSEKTLRGRSLRISPADSWHQPSEDADGKVKWKPRIYRTEDADNAGRSDDIQEVPAGEPSVEQSSEAEVNPDSEEPQDKAEDNGYNILDVLNNDCLSHILSYISIQDLIRSERVSKNWQSMISEYLTGIRTFKTSWWQHDTIILTTAVLRRVLQRLGPFLTRLHIDHHWSALNDRTAHTIGKFCPNLEELKVVGMCTKNWNPLIYNCKQLKNLSFISCNKLRDSSLVQIVKNESCIEQLTIANNTHVTGLFLTGSNQLLISSLAFYGCCSLQGTVLCTALDKLPNLTTLKLDVGPMSLWKVVPLILSKVPKLQGLSLSEYASLDSCLSPQGNDDELCEVFSKLTELKTLNLSRNIFISNALLKQIAQSCLKLESLNVSCCNSKKAFKYSGVGDEGIIAICRNCTELRNLDISYLSGLTDTGVNSITNLNNLTSVTSRGNKSVTSEPFKKCIETCHALEELDVCGCDSVSDELVAGACAALRRRSRGLRLWMAGTGAVCEELETHKCLTVNISDDRCNPHMRPDFIDRIFEDDIMDEFDQEDFDEFFLPDDDDDHFLADDFLDPEDIFIPHYRGYHHPSDILML